MAIRRRWNDLSPRTRRAALVVGGIEAGLKLLALLDLSRRPADQIRGSKAKWAAAIVLVNSAGAVPIAYFGYGRLPRR